MMSENLNIALFSPSKNPYSETFIQAHKNFLKGNVFYYYGNKNNVQLEGHSSLISKSNLRQLKLLRKITNKPFSYIQEQSILKSLAKNKIDVILVEYGTHAFQLKGILKTSKLPVIVHFHGFDASVKKVVKQCNNYKEVFSFSSKIIAVSKRMATMLEDLGCNKNKIIYTPCGPHEDFFEINSDFSKKQFLALGRFVNKKAPYYTILAFKEIFKKHPDASLLMAGDGALFNVCKNLIKLYGLEKNIILLGVVSPEECKKLMSQSLAFVQHSITAENGDMEGTPVSVMEASAAGLPVISTNHAGIPDVIIHKKTGLLSEEHDVEAMAKNMINVLDDISLAKSMGILGKKYVRDNYSMSMHMEVLNSCIKSSI